MANNEIVLDLMEAGEVERAKHVVAWLIWRSQSVRREGSQSWRRGGLEMGEGRKQAQLAGRRLQPASRRR